VNAKAIELLEFLRISRQFTIPIYQRNYSWKHAQCQQLWDDLLRAGSSANVSAHFMGSVVCVLSGTDVATHDPSVVIDGQQRLTTATLLITALANYLKENHPDAEIGGFSEEKLREYYLVNRLEKGDRHYKLLLSQTDKTTLLAILKNTPVPDPCSVRIFENYTQFKSLIEENPHQLEAVCSGLTKLMVVQVTLDRATDNPQLIFESMNSTGLDLSQADLIRNFMLMGLEPTEQTTLYESYWRPMEEAFGQAAYSTYFDSFMRDYLTAKTGDIPNVTRVYESFKRHSASYGKNTEALVKDIYTFALYYCTIVLGKDEKNAKLYDKNLKNSLDDLRELVAGVAHPFLLAVYHDYALNDISSDDVTAVVRLVESYVFRRAVCDIPTNSLNKTFASLHRELDKKRYTESLQAKLLLLESYKKFPSNEEFSEKIKTRDLYHFRSKSYCLKRLENDGRKERLAVHDAFTIEHVLPQNKELDASWVEALGERWQDVQKKWLHTLGNLTLTGYNSEYSDHPFHFKRTQIKDADEQQIGLAHSPLNLNQDFRSSVVGEMMVWNEAAINLRANRLAKKALGVWSVPKLDAATLLEYESKAKKPLQKVQVNTRKDHPYLDVNSSSGVLFDTLRKAILALDPNVHEEYLKLYVAYKLETNFVDIVPQKQGLRLSINMPFNDVKDPLKKCNDISGLGRWGNGDVEVRFDQLDDLPYVISIIQQSLDRQLGDDL
jgi:uncharacterized protein with ParB-like and HNH nuclease domain/predicted transport protein